MNTFANAQEAEVVYRPNDFRIRVNGALVAYDPVRFDGWFVRCAVTQKPIALGDLRYWNVAEQEAYLDAQTALVRWKQLNQA